MSPHPFLACYRNLARTGQEEQSLQEGRLRFARVVPMALDSWTEKGNEVSQLPLAEDD